MSYPDFTSYGIFSQATMPIRATQTVTVINSTSTTVAATSDWSNNGTGRYTYTGANPIQCQVEVDITTTSGTTGKHRYVVTRNGNVSTTPAFVLASSSNAYCAQIFDNNVTSSTLSTTFFSITPFSMFTNDYIELVGLDIEASPVTAAIKVKVFNVTA